MGSWREVIHSFINYKPIKYCILLEEKKVVKTRNYFLKNSARQLNINFLKSFFIFIRKKKVVKQEITFEKAS